MKKKKKWLKPLIITLVILGVIGIFVGVQVKKAQEMFASLTDVQTATVERKSIVNYISATGVLKSETEENITSDLSGFKVNEVFVAVGDEIHVGDTIVSFDSESVKDQLADAKDALDTTKQLNQISLNNVNRTYNDTVRSGDFSVNNASNEVKNALTSYNNMVADYQNALAELSNLQDKENKAAQELEQAKKDKENAKTEANKQANASQLAQKALNDKYVALGIATDRIEIAKKLGSSTDPYYYSDKGFSDGLVEYTVSQLTASKDTSLVLGDPNYNPLLQENSYLDAYAGYVYYLNRDELNKLETAAQVAATQMADTSYYDSLILQKETALESAKAQTKAQQTTVTQYERNVASSKASYDSIVASYQNTVQTKDSNNASASSSIASTKLNQSTTTQENTIATLEKQLDQCVLKSSVSGTVTSVNVSKGGTYASGPIIVVQNCSDLYLSTEIDQYDISNVKKGMKVIIKTDATREEELEGVVDSISPVPSASATGSVTYQVKVLLKNQNDRLKIGMTARIAIITESAEDILAVPYDAVYQTKEGADVLHLYHEDTKETTDIPVIVGLEGDYYIEVKGDQITEGMVIQVPSQSASDAMQELIEQMGGMGGM